MKKVLKERYKAPALILQALVEPEGALLVTSVVMTVDNTGQDKDGWYDDVDYWD